MKDRIRFACKALTLVMCASVFIFAWNERTPAVSARSPSTGNSAFDTAVSLSEDATFYTLANGIITARISKRSGDLTSLRYKDLEMLEGGSGHPFGYWSHSPGPNSRVVNSITIDPASNGNKRAEVSVKGFFQGTPIGVGPGGSTACDIEVRYALGRGESGLYTYSILTHQPDYPNTSVGEARFGVKLNPSVFDYMAIDDKRKKIMPRAEDWDNGTQLNMKEARRMTTGLYKGRVEHKYDYSAIQFKIPAFGWASTEHHLGFWFINPTIEYLSGGPTKVELTGHLDNNQGGAPTLLNYWRGSHYGGTSLVLDKGESWTKVVGPFLIYCNSGATPEAMWHDALSRASREAEAWPYEWVTGVDYPQKKERGTVRGQIVLNDPQARTSGMTNLLVGLSAPDYTARGWRGGSEKVDWQNDAKHYEFWERGDKQGKFSIPNVRPGSYTLHAIADGVLGEYAKADITVKSGENLNLGKVEWVPVRYGTQLWDIGVANRSAEEFKHGDDYWHWGLYLDYPKEFPHDVDFIIGKSNYRTDWNFAQVPRIEHDNGTGNGPASPTTWTIQFNEANAQSGKATLRLAIAGSSVRGGIAVSLNGQKIGDTGPLPDTAVIRRDGIRGYWYERDISFDAALIKTGGNSLTLTIPSGNAFNGVEYDYIRLEVDPTAGKSSEQYAKTG